MKRSTLFLTTLLAISLTGTALVYTGSTWLTTTRCEGYRSDGLLALEQQRLPAAAEQLGNWIANPSCGDGDADILFGYAHAKARLPEPGSRHLVESVRALRQAVTLRPDATPAWRELSLAWAGLGDPARSLAAARKLALLDPDTPESQRLLITALLSAGNHRDARDMATRLIQQAPQRWWLYLARQASENGLPAEASDTVTQASSLPLASHQRLLIQAFEDLLDGRYPRGRERLLEVTETDAKDPLFLQTAVQLMLGAGMHANALDWLNRQEQALTGSLRTLYLQLAWQSGQNEWVTRYLGASPAQLDRAPVELLLHALATLDTGVTEPARQPHFQMPDSTGLPAGQQRWHRLISAVLHTTTDAELVDAAEGVLEIDPRNPVVHQLLADAWIRLKEPLRAARIAEYTMRPGQSWGRPAVTRAQALLLAGNPSLEQYAQQAVILQAVLDSERAAMLTPQPEDQRIGEAVQACETQPDQTRQLNCWKSLALQTPVDLSSTLLALSWAAAADDKTFQQQLIDQIRALTPESSGVWRLAKARLLLSGQASEKHAAEAALLLRHVLKHSPNQADAHLLMAVAMVNLNDPTSAGAHLNEAVAANPRRAGQALQFVLHLAETFGNLAPRTILGWWESITWLEQAVLSSQRSGRAPEENFPATAAQVAGKDVLIERLLVLAAFAERSADRQLAEIVYRRLLQLDQGVHVASNNLAMILYREPQSLDEAMLLAEKAVSAMPTNPDYQDTLNLVLTARERAQPQVQ